MLRGRPVRRGTSRIAFATCLLTMLGLAVLATDGSAQSSELPVTRAKIWEPRTKTGTLHLHGGVFAPIHSNATSATLGTRIGVNAGNHVLLGILGDWCFKSKKLMGTVPGALPGFEPEVLLAKVDAHLVPAMLFVQVKLTDRFPLVPYAGVGVGYEWLILKGEDYRNGANGQVTYANWAWQSHAGVGIRLSQGLRLDSELYYNGAWLTRDVTDQNGAVWREAVDAQGIGARVGLDIVY